MNILASAGQDVSKVVKSLSVLLLIIVPFRVKHWCVSGPTNTTQFTEWDKCILSLQNNSFHIIEEYTAQPCHGWSSLCVGGHVYRQREVPYSLESPLWWWLLSL